MSGDKVTGHHALDVSSRPKLNLFSLYSLTSLLFALIVVVILIAAIAAFGQSPSVLGAMIPGGIVALSLRAFLLRPEERLRSLKLPSIETGSIPPEIAQEADEAARELALSRPPRLIVTTHSVAPTTAGTWRRRYIIIGRPQINRLDQLSLSTRRALWLHEVAHFANGDVWKVGLAQALLQVSVVFVSWNMLFLLAVVLIALVYGLDIFEPSYLDTLALDPALRDVLVRVWPDPATTAPMLEKARAIRPDLAVLYVVNGHLPFIVSGIVLLLFVWRWLVQVREFYADARVAAQMRDARTARDALLSLANELSVLPAPRHSWLRVRLSSLRQWVNRLVSFSPSWEKRVDCLQHPLKVFGSWKWAGGVAGLTVLLLDLILVGPFTLSFVGSRPAHFVTLAGFVILGLWLLPGVCQGSAGTRSVVKQVAGATLVFSVIRGGWLLLNSVLMIGLLFASPAMTSDLLNTFIFLGNKSLTPPSVLPLPGEPAIWVLWAITGAWAVMVLVSLSLFAFLLLAWILFRRLLTWYTFPNAERRLVRVGWGILLILALALALLVLPLPTAVIQGDLAWYLQPGPLAASGATLLAALASGWWFFRTDQRFGRRCTCGCKPPGWFALGKRCPACGEILHPWMLAGY